MKPKDLLAHTYLVDLTSYHLHIFVQESSNEKKGILSIRDMYYTILVHIISI